MTWNDIASEKLPLVGAGLAAGIISSMMGVGGGIILVPMLMFLLGFDIHRAIGTSLLIIIPTSLIGAYAHYRLGNVNTGAALFLIIGAVAGAWVGAHIAESMQPSHLEKAFGVLLLLVSLKMIFWK